MRYEEENNRLPQLYIALEVFLVILFTLFDILRVIPTVSNIIKCFSIVLCLIFSIGVLFVIAVDIDRILLVLSLVFSFAGTIFLLFTGLPVPGIICLCLSQECHACRIYTIKKNVARIDGRIDTMYHSYKVRKRILVLNLILLAIAAIPYGISFFVPYDDALIISLLVLYFACNLVNIRQLYSISRDIRLLDDLKPLHYFFNGMILCLLWFLLSVFYIAPNMIPMTFVSDNVLRILLVTTEPLYLGSLIFITLSGLRHQNFYT